jgi:hypothetical protein
MNAKEKGDGVERGRESRFFVKQKQTAEASSQRSQKIVTV